MSEILSTKKLLVFVLGIAILSLLTQDLYRRDFVEPTTAFAISVSLALANMAVAFAGLRTLKRVPWGIYLIVSVTVFLLLGFSTPISALVALLPIGLGTMVEIMGAA
ncbi:hypothetical protein M8R20_07185 [Pseudomonas sp. R2.Fl]|nr:hypothetical protein [Pseudomonas sp. R2.Fl]